jgi:hypothetical protein
MTSFTSDIDRAAAGYSPDRVDALVWEAWKHMLSSNRPDVSSSNNFCDEENLAQPLVHAISRPDRQGRPSVSSTPILDELQLRLHELEIDEIYARINPLLIGAFI